MPLINIANLPQVTAVNLLTDPGAIPGPVVVPQCAQITINWALESGKLGHSVLYGRYAGVYAGTVAQANAITAGLASGAQWTAVAAFFGTACGISSVSLRDVNTANNPILTATSGGQAGTSASPSLPNEVALVGTLRTAFAGPQFRGRVYVPGWATNALAVGNIASGAAVTALGNWLNTWAAVFSGQGYTWVLGQKARQQYTGSTGRVHPARSATSTNISSVSVRDNHWDTQRRRGLK